VASFLALTVVKFSGIQPLFRAAGAMAVMSATCCLFIRSNALDPARLDAGRVRSVKNFFQRARALLKDPAVRALMISVTLFHVANGPLQSLVSLYMKATGSSDLQVTMLSLAVQPFAIPAAWIVGKYGRLFSRKRFLTVAFLLLPLRILLYTLTSDPRWILAITSLDGIIAGILGLVIVLVCRDLTQGKGGFNFLISLTSLAPALGAVIGTSIQGNISQHFGFLPTFLILSLIGVASALVFLLRMPSTLSAVNQASN
jgi:predicted MFS family arabinose efflux permease